MQKNVVIAGYVRSPFHFAKKGNLARVRPDELAAQVVRGLVEKTGVNTADIEDLILGCAFPEGEQGFNMARIVTFLAQLPISVLVLRSIDSVGLRCNPFTWRLARFK